MKSRQAILIFGDGMAISMMSKKTALVTEANGLDRFEFTFTDNCLVTVTIKEESGETVVELTQSRIPDDKTAIFTSTVHTAGRFFSQI